VCKFAEKQRDKSIRLPADKKIMRANELGNYLQVNVMSAVC